MRRIFAWLNRHGVRPWWIVGGAFGVITIASLIFYGTLFFMIPFWRAMTYLIAHETGMNPWVVAGASALIVLPIPPITRRLLSFDKYRRREGLNFLGVYTAAICFFIFFTSPDPEDFGEDEYFDPMTNQPVKWYAMLPNGTIGVYRHAGVDSKYRTPLSPLTQEIVLQIDARKQLLQSTPQGLFYPPPPPPPPPPAPQPSSKSGLSTLRPGSTLTADQITDLEHNVWRIFFKANWEGPDQWVDWGKDRFFSQLNLLQENADIQALFCRFFSDWKMDRCGDDGFFGAHWKSRIVIDLLDLYKKWGYRGCDEQVFEIYSKSRIGSIRIAAERVIQAHAASP